MAGAGGGGTDTCLTCGGLIIYGQQSIQYSGPICNCIVHPRYQRPSREQGSFQMQSYQNQMRFISQSEYDHLRNENARMALEIIELKKQNKQ